MPIELVGKYEIDFEAVRLAEDAGWAAYAAVFGASENPAHRNEIVPRKRVAVETVFETEEQALAAAHESALALLA